MSDCSSSAAGTSLRWCISSLMTLSWTRAPCVRDDTANIVAARGVMGHRPSGLVEKCRRDERQPIEFATIQTWFMPPGYFRAKSPWEYAHLRRTVEPNLILYQKDKWRERMTFTPGILDTLCVTARAKESGRVTRRADHAPPQIHYSIGSSKWNEYKLCVSQEEPQLAPVGSLPRPSPPGTRPRRDIGVSCPCHRVGPRCRP